MRDDTATLPRVRIERAIGIVCALAGFGLAWIASGPTHALFINWDNAGYIASYAAGGPGWSQTPWNSHFGIGHVYWLGSQLTRLFGGTVIDGFRFTNAAFVAVGAGVLAVAGLKLARSRLVGAALALACVTSWGILVLVLTLEDNILFIPPAVAVLAICTLHVDNWRLRDSIAVGALCGFARLMSYQAAIYLLVPIVVIALFGGFRGVRSRTAQFGALLLSFFGTIVLWVLVVWITTSGMSLASLLRLALYSRPEPSYFPHSAHDAWALIRDWRMIARHLGAGLSHEIGPLTRYLELDKPTADWTGGLFLFLSTALMVISSFKRDSQDGRRLIVVAVVLFAFTVLTSCYQDPYAEKYKRYDYLPIVIVFLIAVGVGSARSERAHRIARITVSLALASVIAVQSAFAVVWSKDFRANIENWSEPGYAGRDGTSWYGYFARIRRENRDACCYVFALSEVANGRHNFEIPAVIWSELPDHRIVGVPDDLRYWKRPLKFVPPSDRESVPRCSWISPAASASIRERSSSERTQ